MYLPYQLRTMNSNQPAVLAIASYPERNSKGKLLCWAVRCRKYSRLHSYGYLLLCSYHLRLAHATNLPYRPSYLLPMAAQLNAVPYIPSPLGQLGPDPVVVTPCAAPQCSEQAMETHYQNHYCGRHSQRLRNAAEVVVNKVGDPLCHARYCSSTQQLRYGYGRLWCTVHYPMIVKIRNHITHYHTIDSYQARLEERDFSYADPTHLKCIVYLEEHLKQKRTLAVERPDSKMCSIIDCYQEVDITEHAGALWCPQHRPTETGS